MTRSPQGRTNRLTRPSITVAAAVAVTAGVVAAAPDAKTAEPTPKLSLIAASTSVTLDSWKEDPGVYLDLGTYLTSENGAFELKVTRKSYKDPVVATQVFRNGKKTTTKALPAGLVKDFSGLPDFAQIKLTDAAGKTVLSQTEAFCPNNASGRVRRHAGQLEVSAELPVNPFTLGSVWGVENGWASNTYAGYYSKPVQLAAGTYTAKINVTKKYRDLFGIANQTRTVKVTVRERSWEEPPPVARRQPQRRVRARGPRRTREGRRALRRVRARRPRRARCPGPYRARHPGRPRPPRSTSATGPTRRPRPPCPGR